MFLYFRQSHIYKKILFNFLIVIFRTVTRSQSNCDDLNVRQSASEKTADAYKIRGFFFARLPCMETLLQKY